MRRRAPSSGALCDVATRDWIRLDLGLLDDDRFEALTPEQCRVWVTAYLLVARERDAVKDLERLIKLLTKQGVPDAARIVAELDAAGWFVPATRREGITLRGYEAAQPIYRGASDSPEAIAQRNAKRATTRAGRRGASVDRVDRGGSTRTDRTDNQTRKRARENGAEPNVTKPGSLKAILGSFDEVIAKGKETAPDSSS